MTDSAGHVAVNRFPTAPAERRQTVVVTSMASDSHTWNLVFLQLLIEELGYDVVNLGPCVPDQVLVEQCRDRDPAMVVISSVNGHGYQDGLRVIRKLRGCAGMGDIPVVIGGKLGVSHDDSPQRVAKLMAAGFDAVFEDGVDGVADFRNFLESMPDDPRALPGSTQVSA
jgi:methylaspartate mutase sigma subunit